MPKVTLLTEGVEVFDLHFGRGFYRFTPGKPKEVPVAVAMFCKNRTDPQFRVDDIGTVVEPVKQNVDVTPRQATQLRLIEESICRS